MLLTRGQIAYRQQSLELRLFTAHFSFHNGIVQKELKREQLLVPKDLVGKLRQLWEVARGC